MKKLLLLSFVLLIAGAAQAQVKCKRSFLGYGNFRGYPTTAIKWSPIVTQGFNAMSFNIEQRVGDRYSVSLAFINHNEFQQESNVVSANIKAHQAIEVNHRFYPIAPLTHGYVQLGTSINSEYNLALNAALGAQEYIFDNIPIDLTVGVQTTNSTIDYYSNFMVRASLAIGFAR